MDINYETAYKEALERTQNVSGEWSSPEAVAKYVFPEIKNLVTKAEEDKRIDSGMSILDEDYQFTRKAEEVGSSPKTLFDKILDKLQNKS